MKRNIRVLLIALVVLAIAGGTFAFAAANTINPGNVGYGASNISGYLVTNIVYTPVEGNMTEMDAVSFTLDKPATTVKITTAATDAWNVWSCLPAINNTELGAFVNTTVVCTDVAGVNTADITHLKVYASDTLESEPAFVTP